MTEHQRAAAWRESLGLNQHQLGELIGYAKATVYWMERGLTAPRRNHKAEPVSPRVWKRYKQACAGLDSEARSKQVFGWEPWIRE
jgi:DNA-binding XRE family transcriptional regulator